LQVQAFYLFFHPDFDHPIWLMGIGFTFLLFCLGNSVLVEQLAYTRAVLPLTISFNLLLLDQKDIRKFFISLSLAMQVYLSGY
jgi:hypothetical protein